MAVQAFDSKEAHRDCPVTSSLDPFSYDYEQMDKHMIITRMANKRQVFTGRMPGAVDADSRLTHTITVKGIAETLAERLGLNRDLVRCIAYGHDVAHCPYGHLGERVLNQALVDIGQTTYDHVIVAPYVLHEVAGLNLTDEVLEGITWHSLSSGVMEAPVPSEYRVVALADKIAYVLGDARDTLKMIRSSAYRHHTTISGEKIDEIVTVLWQHLVNLGPTERERIGHLVSAVVKESKRAGEVTFESSADAVNFFELKGTLEKRVYTATDLDEDKQRLRFVLERLVQLNTKSNPYLMFALLTEGELFYIEQTKQDPLFDENIGALQVAELALPPRDDFTFLAPSRGH